MGGIFLMVGLLLFVLVVVYWRRSRNKLRYLYINFNNRHASGVRVIRVALYMHNNANGIIAMQCHFCPGSETVSKGYTAKNLVKI